MVIFPTVIGMIKLNTYGTLEIGDVPRSALMEKATPKDIANKPVKKNKYLLTHSVFINAFFPFKLFCHIERLKAVSFISGKIWYFPNPNNDIFQNTPSLQLLSRSIHFIQS